MNTLKIGIILSYVFMIALNALANILPINGQNTGAISDSYPNLFAPAGFTFAIWGVIYILLGVLVVALVLSKQSDLSIKVLSTAFILSSVANGLWIIAWHYRKIGISVIIMFVILISLIVMMKVILKTPSFSPFTIKLPIGVYLGWITVATVANITTYLVDIGWNRLGLSEELWLIIILAVATLIALAVLKWTHCPGYGLVILWAYWGIWSKHTAATGFNSQYKGVLITLIVMLSAVSVLTLYEAWHAVPQLFTRKAKS